MKPQTDGFRLSSATPAVSQGLGLRLWPEGLKGRKQAWGGTISSTCRLSAGSPIAVYGRHMPYTLERSIPTTFLIDMLLQELIQQLKALH